MAGDRRRRRHRVHRRRPVESALSAAAPGPGTGDAAAPDTGRAATEPLTLEAAGTRLAARALDLVGTRLALAALELRDARQQLVTSLVLLGVALGAAQLALMFASIGIVAWFWDTHRYRAIAIVTLAYAITATVAIVRVRSLRERAAPLLGASIDELRRDARRLDPRNEDAT